MDDALASVEAGCDALGFIFYKKSPRYITPEKAKDIISRLPKNIVKIGVFVDANIKTITYIAKMCNFKILQLHGSESPEFCKKLKNFKIIKAFRVKDKLSIKEILKYKTFAYLFDTFVKSKAGGSGKTFNWKLLTDISNLKQPVFLSGGLNKENIKQAIETVSPNWVDVSSSLEEKPGKKDRKKVRQFIEEVKKDRR